MNLLLRMDHDLGVTSRSNTSKRRQTSDEDYYASKFNSHCYIESFVL